MSACVNVALALCVCVCVCVCVSRGEVLFMPSQRLRSGMVR